MNIQELAKQAGLKVGTNISGVTLVGSPSTPGLAHISIDEMERFADLVLEEAAKVCDERAMKNERACDGLDDEDATSLRSAAWQMSVCAAAIRALKGAKE